MTGNGDIESHRATYERVTWLIKWSTVVCFMLAGLAIWLIAG